MTSARRFKTAVYGQLARIGGAVASGPRLEMLDVLCQAPRTVEALAAEVSQSVANTSHHLQVLRRSRLVEAEKRGTHVTYRLAGEEVCAFVLSLRHMAESRILEVEEITRSYFEERTELEPVDRLALLERVRSGEVVLLDVRPESEYRVGHLPGARSIPLSDLERRLDELPADRRIVAYCRGPLCVMSAEAVLALRKRGFRADRMPEGVVEFRAAGIPTESTSHAYGPA